MPVDRASGLASDQERVWGILPDTFRLECGVAHPPVPIICETTSLMRLV